MESQAPIIDVGMWHRPRVHLTIVATYFFVSGGGLLISVLGSANGGKYVFYEFFLGFSVVYMFVAAVAGFIALDYKIPPPLRIWPGLIIAFNIIIASLIASELSDGSFVVRADSDILVQAPLYLIVSAGGFAVVSALMMWFLLIGSRHFRKLRHESSAP